MDWVFEKDEKCEKYWNSCQNLLYEYKYLLLIDLFQAFRILLP